jgi:hypothetical protein
LARESWTRIPNIQAQVVSVPLGRNRNRCGGFVPRDSVLDRVLDERLQDHGRHECASSFVRNLSPHRKPISESYALDRKVSLYKLHLATEWNAFGSRIVECDAEE